MSTQDKDWSWSCWPHDEATFAEMMASVDGYLATQNIKPFQRAFRAAAIIARRLAFQPYSLLPSDRVERGPPFGPNDLVARIYEWYRETYVDRSNDRAARGHVVVRLRGTFWRVLIGRVSGSCMMFIDRDLANKGQRIAFGQPASCNVLTLVENLTQPMANRLSEADINVIRRAHMLGDASVAWLNNCPNTTLFDMARADYRHAVQALCSDEFAKTRWECQQTMEKCLKALLREKNVTYRTQGQAGHDLVGLANLATEHLGVVLHRSALIRVGCSPAVRYGDIASSREEAFDAYQTLLRLMAALGEASAPPSS